jgi:hypothetical protein
MCERVKVVQTPFQVGLTEVQVKAESDYLALRTGGRTFLEVTENKNGLRLLVWDGNDPVPSHVINLGKKGLQLVETPIEAPDEATLSQWEAAR